MNEINMEMERFIDFIEKMLEAVEAFETVEIVLE